MFLNIVVSVLLVSRVRATNAAEVPNQGQVDHNDNLNNKAFTEPVCYSTVYDFNLNKITVMPSSLKIGANVNKDHINSLLGSFGSFRKLLSKVSKNPDDNEEKNEVGKNLFVPVSDAISIKYKNKDNIHANIQENSRDKSVIPLSFRKGNFKEKTEIDILPKIELNKSAQFFQKPLPLHMNNLLGQIKKPTTNMKSTFSNKNVKIDSPTTDHSFTVHYETSPLIPVNFRMNSLKKSTTASNNHLIHSNKLEIDAEKPNLTTEPITTNTDSEKVESGQKIINTLTTDLPSGIYRRKGFIPIEAIETSQMESETTNFLNIFTMDKTTVKSIHSSNKSGILDAFYESVDMFERKFYAKTFAKLTSISPTGRQHNGISFVQSGLFLHLVLMAISTEVDYQTKAEIDQSLSLNITDMEKIDLIKLVISELPRSDSVLRFRWASRLVLGEHKNISDNFTKGAAEALQLSIEHLNTSDPEDIATQLNQMVYNDSGGAMQNTFEEDEVSEGVHSVLMTTMYIRGRWRAAPTLLKGVYHFYDADVDKPKNTGMIRVNDIMRYANLEKWNAQAIEISYSTTGGLTLLILVPREPSLRRLADYVSNTSLTAITDQMYKTRVAATLPLYTLRMTLLLPSKLQAMNISRLVEIDNQTRSCDLRLSHAIQRLMFWSEAGRHAYKDDGIEWDEPPEIELVVDRPYIFFVRWRNLTLMNGNFVL